MRIKFKDIYLPCEIDKANKQIIIKRLDGNILMPIIKMEQFPEWRRKVNLIISIIMTVVMVLTLFSMIGKNINWMSIILMLFIIYVFIWGTLEQVKGLKYISYWKINGNPFWVSKGEEEEDLFLQSLFYGTSSQSQSQAKTQQVEQINPNERVIINENIGEADGSKSHANNNVSDVKQI